MDKTREKLLGTCAVALSLLAGIAGAAEAKPMRGFLLVQIGKLPETATAETLRSTVEDLTGVSTRAVVVSEKDAGTAAVWDVADKAAAKDTQFVPVVTVALVADVKPWPRAVEVLPDAGVVVLSCGGLSAGADDAVARARMTKAVMRSFLTGFGLEPSLIARPCIMNRARTMAELDKNPALELCPPSWLRFWQLANIERLTPAAGETKYSIKKAVQGQR